MRLPIPLREEEPWESTTLIGGTCKRGNAFSGPVLIARGLDFEHRVWSYGVLRVRQARALTISAVIAAGKHLFPFRTEKLSLLAPLILEGPRCAALGILYAASRETCAG